MPATGIRGRHHLSVASA